MAREEEIRRWYERYEGERGKLRNSLQRNRGVLLQLLAWEASIVRACSRIEEDLADMHLLDVGCGGGVICLSFSSWGLSHGMLSGSTSSGSV